MNRKTVDTYAGFWLIGLGFLWWPFILVKTMARPRPAGRRPIALFVTCSFLIVSLLIAVLRGGEPARLVAASTNLAIWLVLCVTLARQWGHQDADGVVRGIVDLALFQGVLVVAGRVVYPALSGTVLPLARLLPESIGQEQNVKALTTVNLAQPDYYGRVVIRTAGIFGNATWAGAFAALALVLLLFSGRSLGPRQRRWSIRGGAIALSAVTLYWSYSRVDLLALIVASLAVLTVKWRRYLHPSLWFAMLCLLVATTVAVLPALPLATWFERTNELRQGSLVARGEIYHSTLGEVAKSPTPLVGVGIKERSDVLVASRGTHSTYLGLAYRGGVVCAMAFVVFMVGLAYRGVRMDAELAVGLACFVLIWCFTDDIDVGNFMPMAILIAYGLAAPRPASPSAETDETPTLVTVAEVPV